MLLAAVKFPVFDAFLKNSEEMTGLLGVRRLNDKILSVSDSSPSKCKSDTSSFTVTMLTAAKKNQNNRLGAAASSQKKNKVKKLLTTPNVNTATKLQPFPDDEVAVIISPQQKKVSLLLQN